ncbi:MAG: GNAT family N-acetyltransferase [Pseudomonadota bacterium]|nr:GNAT family N-acetyltransferase [Pseudomonadota bacterium]
MAITRTHALGLNAPQLLRRTDPLGEFALRRLAPEGDAEQVQRWTREPYARYWGMLDSSVSDVAAFYAQLNTKPGCAAYLGLFNGEPSFLVERYDPATDPVGGCYCVRPGDVGMHLLIAPTDEPLHGFSLAVMRTVMAYLFSRPETRRVVVEPDWRNHKIHALNRRVGFVHRQVVQMGEKTAYLAFCTRRQYDAALRWQTALSDTHVPVSAAESVQAVGGPQWQAVNRALVRKCLAEFSHERIIQPVLAARQGEWGRYGLTSPCGAVAYAFKARRLPLDHWDIDPASIEKWVHGQPAAPDAAEFVVEFAETLGIKPQNLPVYVEEVAATAAARARKYQACPWSAEELAGADFQTIETAMTEGHPAFIANSGRIGFDAQDMQRYAPEAASPVQLIWLAVHCSRARFSGSRDLDYQQLMDEELDITTRRRFEKHLTDSGRAPEDYLWMPVHPWQWVNKLSHLFAGELATGHLVYLGRSDDAYLAQQSIRTLFDVSNPGKRYVKTALSVLNMGFTRGLSPDYMQTNPAVNDWVANLVEEDPYLQQQGFCVLREVAGIGYSHPLYGKEPLRGGHLNKTLAALWRESPVHRLSGHQRLMTMAALLHVDAEGDALLPQLIRRSGRSIDAWLTRYFRAYLTPVLHCYYRYGLVFMPHGENVILVIEDDVPVGAIMKDIGEEVSVLNGRTPVPGKIARIAVKMPEDKETLSIFTDVFDCFFRYLSAILLDQADYPPARFWARVADCVIAYQQAHPRMAERFAERNLFAERFKLSCLNRLQLRNNQQLIDLADPFEALSFAGQLDNPITAYRPNRRST